MHEEIQVPRNYFCHGLSTARFCIWSGILLWRLFGHHWTHTLSKYFKVRSKSYCAELGFTLSLYFRISECLIFGSWMLGQALAYAPNMNLAVLSGMHILQILDRKPLVIGTGQEARLDMVGASEKGIKFENVHFSFPARPKIPILRQLNMFIQTGQTVDW